MDRAHGSGGGSNGGRLVQERLLKEPSLDTAIERFLRHQRHHLSNQLLPDLEMAETNHPSSGFSYDNAADHSILGSCSYNNNGVGETWLGFVNGLDLEESLNKTENVIMRSSKDELSGSSSNNRPATRKPKRDQPNAHLIIKGQWTQDEDRILSGLVMKHGERNWSEVAKQLNGRVGKQCRERWNNHLRPNVKKDRWSEEEERQLIEAHEQLGNKWSEIAKHIPGRTENTIKNHWNAARRRQNTRRKKNRPAATSTVLDDYIKANNLHISSRSNPTATATTPSHGSAATGNSALSTTSTEITQEDTEIATDSLHELSQFTSYEDEVMFMQSCFNPTTNISYQPLPGFHQPQILPSSAVGTSSLDLEHNFRSNDMMSYAYNSYYQIGHADHAKAVLPASEGRFPSIGYGGSSGAYDYRDGMEEDKIRSSGIN